MQKFLLILSLFIIFNFLSVFCELCGELLRKMFDAWSWSPDDDFDVSSPESSIESTTSLQEANTD